MAVEKSANWLKQLQRQNAGWFRYYAGQETLAALTQGCRTRKAHLVRPTEAHLAALASFPNLVELSLYEPRAKSLAALGHCKKLRQLQIEDPTAIAGLERAENITSLHLSHFTKITRLDPISSLRKLTRLSLSTITSWDSSRHCLHVQSLAPLAKLKSLRSLQLMGIKPRDLRLDWLIKLPHLKELQISHVYCFGMSHYTALAAALPRTRGTCLKPHWMHPPLADMLRCKKCQTSKVYLTAPGPRKRQMLCPTCDAVALKRHEQLWEESLRAAK